MSDLDKLIGPTKKDPNEYPFPVYGTQGGGLARWTEGDNPRHASLVFVEAPPGFEGELEVGDLVPEEWGYVGANKLAYSRGYC